MSRWAVLGAGLLIALGWHASALALPLKDCPVLTEAERTERHALHVFGGDPGAGAVVRRGYVLAFDKPNRVAAWAAWFATAANLSTPRRVDSWKTFLSDPLSDVSTRDYTGWAEAADYVRGHIVPYFVSGGDRDGDGLPGHDAANEILDLDDACATFEVNGLANIAPMLDKLFNGTGGIWNDLEVAIREVLLPAGRELHFIAGPVFTKEKIERIGDRRDKPETWQIGVPHGFFYVLVDAARSEAVAFLFDHTEDVADGCALSLRTQLTDCIVDPASIERLSGLHFFAALDAGLADELRQSSTSFTWMRWMSEAGAVLEGT